MLALKVDVTNEFACELLNLAWIDEFHNTSLPIYIFKITDYKPITTL